MNDECRMTNGLACACSQSTHVVLRVGPWLLVLLALTFGGCRKADEADPFTRLTNLGKSQLEQGNGLKAVEYFQQALRLKPSALEAHLNLANAHLLANQTSEAIRVAGDALRLDGNSAT